MAAFWDDKKGEIVLCDSVDISIAVATEKVLISFLHVIFYLFFSSVIAKVNFILLNL